RYCRHSRNVRFFTSRNIAKTASGGQLMRPHPPRLPFVVSQIVLLALVWGLAVASVHAQTAPKLRYAVSEMLHHSKAFDVALPLTGSSGIESRSVSGGVTIGLTFDQPVSAATFSINGTGTLNGSAVFSGNTVLVKLAGVSNG